MQKPFSKTFFSIKKLKNTVIDEVFKILENEKVVIPKSALRVRNSNVSKRCAFDHCASTNLTKPSVRIFNVPSAKKAIYEEWLKRLNKPKENLNKILYVCEKHFDSYSINKKGLVKNAVPNCNLRADSIISSKLIDKTIENENIYDFNEESELLTPHWLSKSKNNISNNILVENVSSLPSTSYSAYTIYKTNDSDVNKSISTEILSKKLNSESVENDFNNISFAKSIANDNLCDNNCDDTYYEPSNPMPQKQLLKYTYSRRRPSNTDSNVYLTLEDIAKLKSPQKPKRVFNETVSDKCKSCVKNIKNSVYYQKQLRVLEVKYKNLQIKYI